MLIQPFRIVLGHARRNDLRLPCARRRLEPFELRENARQRIGPLHSRLRQHALPFAEEPQEVSRLHGLDLCAQALDGVAVNAGEQPAFAPFLFVSARTLSAALAESAAHGKALGLERRQRDVDSRRRHRQRIGNGRCRHRTQALEATADDDHQRFVGHRQGLEQRTSLGRDPHIGVPPTYPRNASLLGERSHQHRPPGIAASLLIRQEREPQQGIMQLVGRRGLGPRFGANARDRLQIELTDVGGGFRIEPAAAHHGLGAPLLERCIVQIGVGARIQSLERERRRLGQIARHHPDVAVLESAQHLFESVNVHCLFETISNRLPYQGVVRYLDLARQILRAGHLIRKHRRQQIFGVHSRDLRRDFLAPAEARQGERNARIPAPAHLEHRRRAQRLHEHLTNRMGVQIPCGLCQLEAMRMSQRQHDMIFGGRRLQLEIECPAEPLAQRQSPRAIHAAAERGMDDHLHAAGFVEEALEYDRVEGGQAAERRPARTQVLAHL